MILLLKVIGLRIRQSWLAEVGLPWLLKPLWRGLCVGGNIALEIIEHLFPVFCVVGFVLGFILSILLVIWGAVSIAGYGIDKPSCYASWKDTGYRVRWGYYSGCQISEDGKIWGDPKQFNVQLGSNWPTPTLHPVQKDGTVVHIPSENVQ